MERWRGRVAVVTGASSGIGAAVALDLVSKADMVVVALARRQEHLQAVRARLPEHLRAQFHAVKCDVTDEQAVRSAFRWVDGHLGGLHVLVNNAGVLRSAELLQADNTDDVRATLETNVMGVVYCTREAFNSMRAHGVNDGHVFLINSIAGHQTPNLGTAFPSFNIYPATKHAITSMVETYRQEFLRHGTKTRITSISPGVVGTDIFPLDMDNIVKDMPRLESEDVSNALLFALSTPPHVQVYELVLKPVGEAL